jgi:hypothetical protein
MALFYNCSETPGLGARGVSATNCHLFLVAFAIFLDDRDSYRFRLPGHCGIFTAEMCAIHFASDLIESKPMGAYIILTDSFASIEG